MERGGERERGGNHDSISTSHFPTSSLNTTSFDIERSATLIRAFRMLISCSKIVILESGKAPPRQSARMVVRLVQSDSSSIQISDGTMDAVEDSMRLLKTKRDVVSADVEQHGRGDDPLLILNRQRVHSSLDAAPLCCADAEDQVSLCADDDFQIPKIKYGFSPRVSVVS